MIAQLTYSSCLLIILLWKLHDKEGIIISFKFISVKTILFRKVVFKSFKQLNSNLFIISLPRFRAQGHEFIRIYPHIRNILQFSIWGPIYPRIQFSSFVLPIDKAKLDRALKLNKQSISSWTKNLIKENDELKARIDSMTLEYEELMGHCNELTQKLASKDCEISEKAGVSEIREDGLFIEREFSDRDGTGVITEIHGKARAITEQNISNSGSGDVGVVAGGGHGRKRVEDGKEEGNSCVDNFSCKHCGEEHEDCKDKADIDEGAKMELKSSAMRNLVEENEALKTKLGMLAVENEELAQECVIVSEGIRCKANEVLMLEDHIRELEDRVMELEDCINDSNNDIDHEDTFSNQKISVGKIIPMDIYEKMNHYAEKITYVREEEEEARLRQEIVGGEGSIEIEKCAKEEMVENRRALDAPKNEDKEEHASCVNAIVNEDVDQSLNEEDNLSENSFTEEDTLMAEDFIMEGILENAIDQEERIANKKVIECEDGNSNKEEYSAMKTLIANEDLVAEEDCTVDEDCAPKGDCDLTEGSVAKEDLAVTEDYVKKADRVVKEDWLGMDGCVANDEYPAKAGLAVEEDWAPLENCVVKEDMNARENCPWATEAEIPTCAKNDECQLDGKESCERVNTRHHDMRHYENEDSLSVRREFMSFLDKIWTVLRDSGKSHDAVFNQSRVGFERDPVGTVSHEIFKLKAENSDLHKQQSEMKELLEFLNSEAKFTQEDLKDTRKFKEELEKEKDVMKCRCEEFEEKCQNLEGEYQNMSTICQYLEEKFQTIGGMFKNLERKCLQTEDEFLQIEGDYKILHEEKTQLQLQAEKVPDLESKVKNWSEICGKLYSFLRKDNAELAKLKDRCNAIAILAKREQCRRKAIEKKQKKVARQSMCKGVLEGRRRMYKMLGGKTLHMQLEISRLQSEIVQLNADRNGFEERFKSEVGLNVGLSSEIDRLRSKVRFYAETLEGNRDKIEKLTREKKTTFEELERVRNVKRENRRRVEELMKDRELIEVEVKDKEEELAQVKRQSEEAEMQLQAGKEVISKVTDKLAKESCSRRSLELCLEEEKNRRAATEMRLSQALSELNEAKGLLESVELKNEENESVIDTLQKRISEIDSKRHSRLRRWFKRKRKSERSKSSLEG